MSVLVVAAPQPQAGKTAVAAGLAQNLAQQGRPPALLRLRSQGEDVGAQADAQFFATPPLRSPWSQPLTLAEATAAIASQARGRDATVIVEGSTAIPPRHILSSLGGRLILVARYGPHLWDEVATVAQQAQGRLAGIVVTAVPRARLAATGTTADERGLPLLALLPEDRLLASPTVAEIAQALNARVLGSDERLGVVVEHLIIGSIASDPGYPYFARFGRKAVITRYDRPDLLLAALNAEAQCLVLTGGGTPLEYVTTRATAENVPLLLVEGDTLATMQTLEELYGATRFTSQEKLERMAQLLGQHMDPQLAVQALAA